MNQENNNKTDAKPADNKTAKKQHYREVLGDSSNNMPNAQNGNRNNKTRSADGRNNRNDLSANGTRQYANNRQNTRYKKPRGRKPVQTNIGSTGPVERNNQKNVSENKRNNERVNQPAEASKKAKDVAVEQISVKNNSDINAKTQPKQNRNARTRNHNPKTARWEKKIRAEETYEDIRRDNERIEKEIWLEIASIHTIKLDF